jgi:hypothetical protein
MAEHLHGDRLNELVKPILPDPEWAGAGIAEN